LVKTTNHADARNISKKDGVFFDLKRCWVRQQKPSMTNPTPHRENRGSKAIFQDRSDLQGTADATRVLMVRQGQGCVWGRYDAGTNF